MRLAMQTLIERSQFDFLRRQPNSIQIEKNVDPEKKELFAPFSAKQKKWETTGQSDCWISKNRPENFIVIWRINLKMVVRLLSCALPSLIKYLVVFFPAARRERKGLACFVPSGITAP